MPPTWLNLYTSASGVWLPGQDDFLEIGVDQAINPSGSNVRLYETARSGYVTLSPIGGQIAVGGDAEVLVCIDYANAS